MAAMLAELGTPSRGRSRRFGMRMPHDCNASRGQVQQIRGALRGWANGRSTPLGGSLREASLTVKGFGRHFTMVPPAVRVEKVPTSPALPQERSKAAALQ